MGLCKGHLKYFDYILLGWIQDHWYWLQMVTSLFAVLIKLPCSIQYLMEHRNTNTDKTPSYYITKKLNKSKILKCYRYKACICFGIIRLGITKYLHVNQLDISILYFPRMQFTFGHYSSLTFCSRGSLLSFSPAHWTSAFGPVSQLSKDTCKG